jgi:hypothetical protein
MLKKLPILAAFLLLLLTGLLHGRITDRWGHSGQLEAAVAKLRQVPLLAGDWDGTVTQVNDDPVATKGMGAYAVVHFTNRVTGDTVSVTLVCGRPGPLSLHPPTICFPAHGYAEKGGPTKVKVARNNPRGVAEFMADDFVLQAGAVEERLHVLWAYGHNGDWVVPQDPRTAWARERAVYKFYVSRQSVKPDNPLDEDSSLAFLRAYLPELEKTLFGS